MVLLFLHPTPIMTPFEILLSASCLFAGKSDSLQTCTTLDTEYVLLCSCDETFQRENLLVSVEEPNTSRSLWHADTFQMQSVSTWTRLGTLLSRRLNFTAHQHSLCERSSVRNYTLALAILCGFKQTGDWRNSLSHPLVGGYFVLPTSVCPSRENFQPRSWISSGNQLNPFICQADLTTWENFPRFLRRLALQLHVKACLQKPRDLFHVVIFFISLCWRVAE